MLRLLQSLISSMSLERKCLLFFGSALMILMCMAFVAVLVVGDSLINNNTQQRARDIGAAEVMLLHERAIWRDIVAQSVESDVASDEIVSVKNDALRDLRNVLLDDEIQVSILGLDDGHQFENLSQATLPASPTEEVIIERLETKFRTWMEANYAESHPELDSTIDLAENRPMLRLGLSGSEPIFEELKRVRAEEFGIPGRPGL